MVITKTPFRMSFFGGGTDIEEYFKTAGGAVLSTTIDKYCYVTVRHLPPFFDYKSEIAYAKIERIQELDEIQHPMVRNAMKMLDMKDLRITYEGDLPARSGLGTSSSFAVGLLNAFYCLNGKYANKKRLADEAIYLERVLCNEAGGWQDQIAASFGGLNRIDFNSNGYEVRPIIISSQRKKELSDNLIMLFTGFTRFSSEMQEKNNITQDTSKLDELKKLVDQAESILENDNLSVDEFGRLMDYTWKIKRTTGQKVTTNIIDELYERGMKAGALGGKLLGAGGGGFMVFYVQPEKRDGFKREMGNHLEIPFNFEDGGTSVVHYVPED